MLPSVELGPAAMPPRPDGTSELTTVTPTGAREGRRSWTAALGVAVAAETLLLWLASLVILRRNRVAAPFRRRMRSIRPKVLGPTR
ncbi:hypothetical protein [Actinoallomurus soli]|uniref:hypothetical protein n=1 Tax=Actinoallomurus soli TaxID=2952535 RepID=UPI0020939EF4|nr:hypothetical protein [Actinoallomurus soli]MCO5973432.1 hypothetical protein [Actinoallomurus soli]